MSSSKYNFSRKVVLITGSSSGIGAACALAFARSGARCTITGYEEGEVQSLVRQIQSITGETPFSMAGDLTSPGFPEALVAGTVKAYGKIDILVNNAGWVATGDSFKSDHASFMDVYEKVMNLNLKTVLKMMHLCAPHLEATKGCIVNTSSVCAMTPLRSPVYCSAKAAVDMATKVAALELGDKGIRVNSVNPGPIRTNIGRYIGNQNLMLGSECPETSWTIQKRNGEPEEVANVYLFLASDDASYVTGANYVVDGGLLCH